MNKHIILIGGAALAGVAVLVLIMREHSASPAGAYGPQPAELPGVPQYPALPPLPPFTVNATPYYLTVNYPPDRNLTAPQQSSAVKDGCGCKDKCNKSNTLVFTQPQLQSQAAIARSAVASGGNGNFINQFPPSQFPWLYSGGGAA